MGLVYSFSFEGKIMPFTKHLFIAFLISINLVAGAHVGHKQTNTSEAETKKGDHEEIGIKHEEINALYLANIKPIFQIKCFNCHSTQTIYPWYSNIPGIKQLIASDINEALQHLNLESNFPFNSHATPKEDLESINKEILENEMPPFLYSLLHSEGRLTDVEKKKVATWVRQSQILLNSK